MNKFSIHTIKSEVEVKTSRSGGPGGQHVNKVETKVTLRFNVAGSTILSADEKSLIQKSLSNKLTKEGHLIITSDGKRSQLKNKEIAFKKLDRMLNRAFAVSKPRKATIPTKASVKKRLESKRKHSEKKGLRKRINH